MFFTQTNEIIGSKSDRNTLRRQILASAHRLQRIIDF